MKTLHDKKREEAKPLSEMFIEANRFLPDKLFSVKKVRDYSLGVAIDDRGAVAPATADGGPMLQLSPKSKQSFLECQSKLIGLKRSLDESGKAFLVKALRDVRLE